MNASRVNAAGQAILAAQKSRQTAAGIAAALDTAGYLQSPGEVRELNNRVARYRIAWRMARTRALSLAGAADRAGARVREMLPALQDSVGAILVLQMQRDALRKRLAEFDLAPSCDRCGCTDDEACDEACAWVPNSFGLDLCSGCIHPDGRCTTPLCGEIAKPMMLGWILVDVASSEEPARFHCSPWCAARAIQAIGERMAEGDRTAAAAPEKDTHDGNQPPVGESTPVHTDLAGHQDHPEVDW